MNPTHDWKKQASTVFKDEELEQAFMNQAYSFIQNKAGKLLSDPYRLGFEIVFKNETATRLVGVFAFRNGNKLLYAPCFFINGQIKGVDLLYQQDTKKFVPLTEEWVNYILDASQPSQGSGFDQEKALSRSMDVHKLVIPPSGRGWSEKAAGDASEVWAEIQEEGIKQAEFKPLLKDFLVECGGVEAVAEIEKMVKQSMEFAEGLSKLDPETWAPEGVRKLHTKEAAATEEPGKLTLVTQVWHSKEASVQESIVKRGYDLIDERHDLVPAMVHDIDVESIGRNGLYDVLTTDGEMKRAVCIVCSEKPHSYDPGPSSFRAFKRADWTEMCVLFEDGSVTHVDNCHEPCKVYGKCVLGPEEDWAADTWAQDKPSTGSTYICYDPDNSCICKGKVTKVSEKNGILKVTMEPYSGCSKEIVINPDIETTYKTYDGMACQKALWFKCTAGDKYEVCKKGPSLSTEPNLETYIKSVGMVPAELRSSQKSAGERFELKIAGRLSEDIDKMAMVVKVAKDLKVYGPDAIELVEKCASEGKVHFWLQQEEMQKSGAFRLVEDPDFYMDQDSEFNIPVDRGVMQALDIDQDTEFFPGRRLGDAEQPQGGSYDEIEDEGISPEEMFSQTPEQIAQIAQMRELPKVFEHGLVGSLVNSQDAVALVGRYSQELLDSVDALARILFLFYWKPGEMQDAYGVDDMHHMEDQLLSTFKLLGELTLDLLKRNKTDDGALQVSPA